MVALPIQRRTRNITEWGGVASLKFNQLIQNGNFADGSGWSVDYTTNLSVENNIGTLKAGSSQGTGRLLLTNKRQTVVGHKYCLKLSYYVPNGGFTGFLVRHRGPYDNIPLTTIGRWEDAYRITEISSANDILLLTNERVLTVAEEVSLQNVMCIDLTYMYGEGNEPSDVEVVKADCRRIGHPLDVYQPYTPIPQLT